MLQAAQERKKFEFVETVGINPEKAGSELTSIICSK